MHGRLRYEKGALNDPVPCILNAHCHSAFEPCCLSGEAALYSTLTVAPADQQLAEISTHPPVHILSWP